MFIYTHRLLIYYVHFYWWDI